MKNLNQLIESLNDNQAIVDHVAPAHLANDILRTRLMCMHYMKTVQSEITKMLPIIEQAMLETDSEIMSNELEECVEKLRDLQDES